MARVEPPPRISRKVCPEWRHWQGVAEAGRRRSEGWFGHFVSGCWWVNPLMWELMCYSIWEWASWDTWRGCKRRSENWEEATSLEPMSHPLPGLRSWEWADHMNAGQQFAAVWEREYSRLLSCLLPASKYLIDVFYRCHYLRYHWLFFTRFVHCFV